MPEKKEKKEKLVEVMGETPVFVNRKSKCVSYNGKKKEILEYHEGEVEEGPAVPITVLNENGELCTIFISF